jgi:hypothetical protein
MDQNGNILSMLRKWKHRYLFSGEPDAARVGKAVDAVIDRAKRREKAGERKDRWLFGFESDLEEISDEIARLKEAGEKDAYRDIYAKLYAYAAGTMEESYMPIYLNITYRYANALLETGGAEEALRLYEKLYERTDRLIGVENPYGIHCLERIAQAASQCGQPGKTDDALRKMSAIAEAEYGPDSAMMQTVRRCAAALTAR